MLLRAGVPSDHGIIKVAATRGRSKGGIGGRAGAKLQGWMGHSGGPGVAAALGILQALFIGEGDSQ